MAKILRKTITILLGLLVGGYALAVGTLYTQQRHIIYKPTIAVSAPESYGLNDFADITIHTTDHVALQCWYHKAQKGFPTIAYFHGQGGNLSDRKRIFPALANKGFGVLGLSYRGFGKSEGSPSEQGLYDDARAAIAFLTTEKKLPLSQIMLFGESLGTGVAIKMATEYKVAGIILESPYTSIADRAAAKYPYVPVSLLLKDRFDSIVNIPKVHSPLLLFHGEKDIVVPVAEGRAILAAANPPKEAIFFADKGHVNFDSAVISEHVLNFANKERIIAP